MSGEVCWVELLPSCALQDVVMNIDDGNKVKGMKKTGREERRCNRRCKRKHSSLHNVVPLFIFYIIPFVVVFLAKTHQPVAAFTAPVTTIGIGISRNKKNHTSAGVLLGAATRPSQGEDSTGPIAPKPSFSPWQRIRLWKDNVRTAYRRRTNADPSFLGKSVTEVLAAAGTQLMAEWNRRGASRMVSEIDFVVPAVLTAVFGKYYRCVRQKP